MSNNPPQNPGDPQLGSGVPYQGGNASYQGDPNQFQGNPAGAPQPPKKNWFARHKILTGIGILVILIILGSAIGGGAKSDDANKSPEASAASRPGDGTAAAPSAGAAPNTTKAAQQAAAMPKIGEVAKDGKTEFTVTSFDCGLNHVGADGFGKDAQGQYCLATVQMKNTDSKAISWFDANQKLLDATGATYKTSNDGLYVDGANLVDDVNPGNTLTSKILFDVPKDGFQPKALELHDSAFSKGVKVDISNA